MLSKFTALLLNNIADGHPTSIYFSIFDDVLNFSTEKRRKAFFYCNTMSKLVKWNHINLGGT